MKLPKVTVGLLETLRDNYIDSEIFLEQWYGRLLTVEELDTADDEMDKIVDQYEYLDHEVEYWDFEKAYEEIVIYFKYDNNLWGCRYAVSAFDYWGEVEDKPFLVEPHQEVVIKYKPIKNN